jgi:hypothetical protein
MIIVEIGRGLGNSMYVYAAALALAKHKNAELKLDTSYLKSWPAWEKYGGLWEFELGKLNISAPEASKKEIRKFVIKTGFRPIDKIIRKYKLFDRSVVYFPSNGLLNDFFAISDNSYLRGYFGREKFFKGIKEQIKKEFTLKEEYKLPILSLLEKISKENSVSLHVRRGDLLTLKNTNVIGLDYYKKAIELIKSKIKNPVFYVFSDEIGWCKENFKEMGAELRFIEDSDCPNTGYHVLEVMKSCKHNILANSALSWWAGYLNTNPKKIVIAPGKFEQFTNVEKEDDRIPEGWIKID